MNVLKTSVFFDGCYILSVRLHERSYLGLEAAFSLGRRQRSVKEEGTLPGFDFFLTNTSTYSTMLCHHSIACIQI